MTHNPISKYIHQIIENIYPDKMLYINFHNSTIHNGQINVQTNKMYMNKWIDKQNAKYPYNGFLFTHKREWNTDTFYINEFQKYFAKWKKPYARVSILYELIYMK